MRLGVCCGRLCASFSFWLSGSSALRSLFLLFFSAILLILSHPPYNLWFLAWFSLVPLFFVIEGKTFWQSFRLGYLFGIFYFFGMFWWFIHVTLPGMILLNMFLALYFALFAGTCALISRKNLVVKVLLIACAWVAWEFVRARFLSGFGWATLGHTQYQQFLVTQLSTVTGVFGISFILVVFNYFIYFVMSHWHERKVYRKTLLKFGLYVFGMIILIGAHAVSEMALNSVPSMKPPINIAVVQPNIAQEDKWDVFKREMIMSRLTRLTKLAAEQDPDVIVWPEASLPALPELVPLYLNRVKMLAKDFDVPILLGYVQYKEADYYNSAGLIDRDGTLLEEYHKIHLVPFGEFIPFRKQLSFLTKIVPIEDISSGKNPTVFSLKENAREYPFSVLICFEDAISPVARKLVRSGAEILFNITNDAWFRDTKAPWLHLQAAVFQAVSFKRPLVRSANTGVSVFINRFGQIKEILRGEEGAETFDSGVKIFNVYPSAAVTFYLIFGDIFAYLCIACLMLNVIINNINIKFTWRKL